MSDEDDKKATGFYSVLGLLSGLGMAVVIPVVGGVVGGVWLDGKAGTKPLFTFCGLGVGLLAAGWLVYRMVMRTIK